MGSQVYETSTSPPVFTENSESQAYGGTTATPGPTTTEWTPEGQPTEIYLDGKVIEAQEITESNDVPGSETKNALPGREYQNYKYTRSRYCGNSYGSVSPAKPCDFLSVDGCCQSNTINTHPDTPKT